VTSNHAPVPVGLTRPHSRVPIDPARDTARDVHCESGTERRNRDVSSDSSDSQLLRLVLPESNEAGSVRGQVVAFGRKIPIRPGEEQVVGDQLIELVRVRVELR